MTDYASCKKYFFDDVQNKIAADPDSNAVSPNATDFPVFGTKTYWEAGTTCLEPKFNQNNIKLRPCCGLRMSASTNRCEIITQKQCEIQGGTW